MPKDPSPLLGYNNNIRHKNRVFHVQTEDSGVRHPHIITHLFMDGGRILKSVKTSYAEHVGADRVQHVVRQMMKEQHKGMLIALRDGQFDHLVDPGESPKPVPPPSPSLADAVAVAKAPEARAARIPSPPPVSDPTIRDALEAEGPVTTRMPPREGGPPPSDGSVDVDVGTLERAASEAPHAFEPQSDLPPPPANLFRAKEHGSGGEYRTLTPPPDEAPVSRSPTSRPPASKSGSRPPRSRPAARRDPRSDPPVRTANAGGASRSQPPPSASGAEGRYAPARPAAIFGQSRPKRGNSIFGEDLISDKSLDEVILSYLAEDLEAPSSDTGKKRKK